MDKVIIYNKGRKEYKGDSYAVALNREKKGMKRRKTPPLSWVGRSRGELA